MKKNNIRLTESQLHRVIKESVRKVLKEGEEYSFEQALEQKIKEIMFGLGINPDECDPYNISDLCYEVESQIEGIVEDWYADMTEEDEDDF